MARKFAAFLDAMTEARKQRINKRTQALLDSIPLQELRQARNFSQEALAALMGASQSSISKFEKRTDMYVSTLRQYVEALGGVLEIRARFPDREIAVTNFGDADESANRTEGKVTGRNPKSAQRRSKPRKRTKA